MWKLFRDFCLILLCFTGKYVQCFNFDTNFPIVYVDPHNFSGYPLEKTSYFGYSVLLYEGGPNNNPWIQVGAPRGRNPNWGNELTGVVYRCGVKSTCYHVNLIPAADDSYAGEAYFGNSMDISNDKNIYAVCGHRWIENKTSDYYMEGACFGGKTTENGTTFYKPLHKQLGQLTSISGVRVYNTAQAQLGFSAQFSQSKENELLVGLPGLLNWKGSAGLLSKAVPPEAARRRRRRSTDELESAFIPEMVTVDDVKFFDLAGYSVTSGRFYSNGELYYATGAPRAGLKGSVLIYRFVKSKITIFERKDGTHVGEYFGSAITASDINGDGKDDLIVGAPFHKSDTSESKYDGGAIYVYVGSSTQDKLTDASTNIIKGKSDGGRFGEAVMSLGDIDKDGFADIAVAAPYDNDKSGVVYIFRGNGQSGLIKEPSQIIKGRDIIPDVRGFGISLSKPADIDGNKYSDFAIGAYQSGHAVLLRGKPVVVLDHNLTSSVNQISASNLASSFEITSCVSYHGVDIDGITQVNIRRILSVDKGVSDRAYLEDATNLDSTMDRPNQAYCSKYVVKIKPATVNIYDPIVIRASIELIKPAEAKSVITVTDKVEGTDGFCRNCAIPRSTTDTDRQINVDFNRECGSDNICDAFLQLSAKFTDLKDEKYVIGSKEYITLEAMVSNSNENAFQTEVLITLPSPVRLKRIPPNCKESIAEIACTIDNPLKNGATKTVSLELDVDEINTGKYDADLQFLLRVKTSSNNTGESEKTLSLGLVKTANIELKGASSEETYSYINRTYGKATFQQVYKILKYDISPIQRAKLTVNIPTSVAINGKEVKFLSLYAPEGSLAGQSITCQSSIDTIMDNNVPVVVGDGDKKKRKRREVSTVDEQLSKYPANRTIYFNCSSESVQEGTVCGSVTCDFGPLKNIKNTAEIRFKMILDISELTDYKPDKDIVIVSTSGTAQIVDNVVSSGGYSHEVSVPSVFIGPSAEQSIAIWIIIVAVICGILLLALLAGGLYKLGFFKREKKAMLMEEKAKQNAEDTAEPLTTGAQT